VTVPPAWKKLDIVEESVTDVPTVIVVADRVVVMVGLALLTVKGSQALVAALLLASPEYTALKLNDPAGEGVTGAEFGTTPFVTVTVETTVAVPAHVPPVNWLYVTGPPAWKKLAIVDESVTDVPTVTVVAERVVVIVGLALLTVRGSQALVAALLFTSPL